MDEYLYCVTADGWQNCKMGYWHGYYSDLWSRYATPFGPDETSLVVFACNGRQALEKILFGMVRTMHLSGEVYQRQAQDTFMKFCGVMCLDSIPFTLSDRAKDKRDAVKAEKAKVKAKAKEYEKQSQEAERRAKDDKLDTFISTRCRLQEDGRVDTTAFREAFESFTEGKITPSAIKTKMEDRHFFVLRKRLRGKHEGQYFAGIVLI